MKIEILGSSGSVMQGYDTTSILINDRILIDAGSVASVLSEDGMSRIRNVLITHAHIDHIKELPFLVDALFMNDARGLRIMGSKTTIDALKAHVFNGLIWPDMAELDTASSFMSLEYIPEDWFELEGLMVKAFPVNHIEGSLGYILGENGKHALFTGDTGYHQGLFDLIVSLGDSLKACFIEASFPNRMGKLASITQHLTPELVIRGLNGVLSPSTRVIIYHIKPKNLDEVIAELPEGYEHIRGGEVYVI